MSRPRSRVLLASVAAVALTALSAPVASAHVTVNSPTAARSGYGVLNFLVPNESKSGSLTTKLTVTVPNLKSARTEPQPGWTSEVVKDPTSALVTSVTWTADPGTGIAAGQFGQFFLSAGPLPDSSAVSFPAAQTYADGTVVNWADPVNADGSEPDHPAPVLKLAADDAASSSTSDKTARWLGIAGLIVGAVGVLVGGVALTRRRA